MEPDCEPGLPSRRGRRRDVDLEHAVREFRNCHPFAWLGVDSTSFIRCGFQRGRCVRRWSGFRRGIGGGDHCDSDSAFGRRLERLDGLEVIRHVVLVHRWDWLVSGLVGF